MTTSETATGASNNTNMSARMALLTLNGPAFDHFSEVCAYLKKLVACNYFICCLHNKGHLDSTEEHIHIACQFTKPTRLSIRKLHGAHVDIGKYGSIQAMVAYVKGETGHKDIDGFIADVIEEYGSMRTNGGLKTRDLETMTYEELKDLHPTTYSCCAKLKEKIDAKTKFQNMLSDILLDDLKHPNVIYLTGDSGSGKTYQAYKFATCMYDITDIGQCSIHNNFFEFVNPDAKCMVIEEFRPSQCNASLFLQFTDAYGFNAPIKGGYHFVRPETIIICSIIPSAQIYQHEELNKQFQRRIKFEFDKSPNVRLLDS